jgi:HSP20 family protein
MIRSLVPFRDRGGLVRPEVALFGSLHREIDCLFDDFARGFSIPGPQGNVGLTPSIDVSETDKEIEITAELPGLERKEIEISLDDNVLTIRGEKKFQEEQKDEKNKNYRMSERSYGMFYRTMEQPNGIDPASIQATMSKGVLKITVAKPEPSKAKKIEIKEAGA